MSELRSVPVVLLGLGNVGSALLRQILETRREIAQRRGLRLTPIALADISGLIYDLQGLPEETLLKALQTVCNGYPLEAMGEVHPLEHVAALLQPGVILADVTASPKTAPTLRSALEAECGVALANKIPLAAPWREARAFFEYPHLRYEVTVGAGLPVIATLHYLLNTGDRVLDIEGCLSGTLGYLCAELERGVPYSVAVAQARALGYTEPNPRDDLSGKDVARKALILARTAGWPLEEHDLAVEPLYPTSLSEASADEFMAALPSLDQEYATLFAQARAEGKTLRYVARMGPQGGKVGLAAVPRETPLGALRGPANFIAIRTTRYEETPLAISGPGAGREVTAAGLLWDMLELAKGGR